MYKKWKYSGTLHQLFIDLEKACDFVRREVLCSILIEFCMPMELFRLIKMCLNRTSSKVCMELISFWSLLMMVVCWVKI